MLYRAPICRILAVSGFAAMMGPAQQTETSAEVTQRDTPFTFSTGVNLVLVPVVVRDREGHAIGTLKKEDFQLFDKGKLQEISKFSIEKAEAPPTLPDTSIETDANGNPQAKPAGPAAQPIAGHFIMWLFDDMHLSFGDLGQTREAAKRVLKEILRARHPRRHLYDVQPHLARFHRRRRQTERNAGPDQAVADPAEGPEAVSGHQLLPVRQDDQRERLRRVWRSPRTTYWAVRMPWQRCLRRTAGGVPSRSSDACLVGCEWMPSRNSRQASRTQGTRC